MSNFVHLHVHSEYSLLDGYASTKAIAKRAADLGMPAIAITDHGVMYGAMEFYDAAKKAGVKPIIGVEAYVADGKHTERNPQNRGYFHLLMLAQNEAGYRNLVKLTTRAHVDGFYRKPRIDHDLLEQHHEGLILTSACLGGEICSAITKQDKEKARQLAGWYRDLLGPDNFYLELQLHENAPELENVNDELVRIGQELGIPLVATTDAHFVKAEDVETQKLVMALGFGMTYQDLCNRGIAMDSSYHIMTPDDMWQRFKRYGTAPMDNTVRIAEMCNLSLGFGRVQLPQFDLPAGHDAASYLKYVCEEGLKKHFKGTPPPQNYWDRLYYELDVINQTGFPDYMLIVWDYVKYARTNGVPCIPRGSAGASIVLYCLEITDVDPVENKLLFERFLSPERLEMPDIDIDFADDRRHLVLDYIANKYGRMNTAQIITYGTLGAKAAMRDMGRVLDVPLSEVDRAAKLIPSLPVGISIAQAMEKVPDLKQIYDGDARMRQVIDGAMKIEGRMRNVGTHACGVVVSRNPLEEIAPLQRTTKDENALMVAYEGNTIGKLGLLKMDILGLTNLSIVARALEYIRESGAPIKELIDIPLDDKKVFDSLGRGETVNVFQMESTGMTRYLKELKPTRVDDLYAMVALYRPGPLEQIPVYIRNKNNPAAITYIHPILEPLLSDTYGVIVYQEQIMQLLQVVADYTLGQAYIVIKAISKKNKELMAENGAKFKEGCLKKGLTQSQADQLWELILPFAGYSFNRPHSTLYGLLSYQTSYLKLNYPVEYMAAVLGQTTDLEEITKSVAEASRMGVAVLPIDVNGSQQSFGIEELPLGNLPPGVVHRRAIRFGLSAIKSVGEGPVETLIKARKEGGPFRSLEEFCARIDRQSLNKRVVESLIKCGAMDSLPGTRKQKLAMLDQAIGVALEAHKARQTGQSSLFDLMSGTAANSADAGATISVPELPLPNVKEDESDRREYLVWEKELLGMYVSSHPVAHALEGADTRGTTALGRLSDEMVGQTLNFIGMVRNTRRLMTKKGDPMLVGVIEDLESSVEFVVFPKTLARCEELLKDDSVIKLSAKVDQRRDSLQLIVESCNEVQKLGEGIGALEQAENELVMAEDENGNLVAMVATLPPAYLPPVTSAPPPPGYTPPVTAAPPAPVATAPEPYRPSGDASMTSAEGVMPMTAAPPAQAIDSMQSMNVIRVPTRTRAPAIKDAPATNGNGNGYAPQNGQSSQAGAASGRMLRISLPRSTDFDADTTRMQSLSDILHTSEGPDIVWLYIENGIGTLAMRMHHTIRISEQLVTQVQDVVGAGVEVG